MAEPLELLLLPPTAAMSLSAAWARVAGGGAAARGTFDASGAANYNRGDDDGAAAIAAPFAVKGAGMLIIMGQGGRPQRKGLWFGSLFFGKAPFMGCEPLGFMASSTVHTWLSRSTQGTPGPEILATVPNNTACSPAVSGQFLA
eukprot:1160890-Pelagomonas_calceolata.AAC.9